MTELSPQEANSKKPGQKSKKKRNRSRGKCAVLCHCEAFFKGRGNLNRCILDCFVAKLLAMTPATQLIRRERLPKNGRTSLIAVIVPPGQDFFA